MASAMLRGLKACYYIYYCIDMNYKALDIGLKAAFLVITAFIAADMVNTTGRGAMQTLPSFKLPEKVAVKVKVEEEQPVPAEEAVEPALEAFPPARLIGTITGAYPHAVIFDPASNKQELYGLRDDIGGGWLIYEIGKNTVVVKKGEQKETLEVKFIEGEPKGETVGIAHPTGKGIRLDQRDVEGALSDMNTVMTQARVVPNLVEGKTRGYRMFNIVPGSIFTKLGIQNNDIVERVNGVEINSPDTLYQLFQQIKSERKLALDFNRGGRRESVNVEIR
ncbi:MAG: PDZ domain-containing protein [Deltaproteobacteria bacterium]|nr:PDZ domain-containing protein [Deltaproteobacteria bacterium]